ncbi:nucleotidyltransferase family protein [Trichocoleus sp. ST-U3]
MRSAESSSARLTPRFANAIAFLNLPNWWLAGGAKYALAIVAGQ